MSARWLTNRSPASWRRSRTAPIPITTGFTATITWANGHTTSGAIAFAGTNNETNINGQIVAVSLFTVTGTYTYATAGTYPISVTITDPNGNTATVNPTARVAYPPLVVTGGAAVNAACGYRPHQ